MEQLEKDKAALKQARQELEWKQSEVDRLERAVEFGRCEKCNEPLMSSDDKYCEDCLTNKPTN